MKVYLDGVGEVDTDTVLTDWTVVSRILDVPGAMRDLQRQLNIISMKPKFEVDALKEAVKLSIYEIESKKSDVKALQEIVGM